MPLANSTAQMYNPRKTQEHFDIESRSQNNFKGDLSRNGAETARSNNNDASGLLSYNNNVVTQDVPEEDSIMLDKSMLSQLDAISQYETYKESNIMVKSERNKQLVKFRHKANERKFAK